ncbi:MAG: rod shape-determining protein RodA [Myxococcales bacterium]|nr:rod shape-determining protein RodA [Myxococcota bacterium]MDW8281329.1 rod shape-determining protein RodA [Myxococcales bacterium]
MMLETLRRLRAQLDWPVFIPLGLLVLIGLVNLYSATRVAPQGLFVQQLWWYAIGSVLFIAAAAVDYRILQRHAWTLYIVLVLLLVFVLLGGKTVNGSRRWIGIGSFGGQPSELMKIGIILALARLFSGDPLDLELRPLRYALLWHLVLGVPALLILKQPDLGTALICTLVAATMLVCVRLRPAVKAAVAAVDLSAAALVFLFGLKAYQKKRLLTFLNPAIDPTGAGWHARQALFAIGSGQWFGKGYLRGTQNQLQFLPEHWTDFPFAVWAEEWGLVGCLVLLLAYLLLLLWALSLSSEARDRFARNLTLGCTALLFWHIVVNIAMVSGMIPVVGVTLPLISYGGTSLLTVLITLGLLMNVSIRRYSY